MACEQALLFGRAKRAARASSEAARGRRKESLQPSLTNFHLYFAQTKGNTIGWKMTFRKLKLSDNRPSRPALNFRGKCRNTMLFSPKTRVMSAIAELTPKKKTGRGRKSLSPSVRDNCRLCGCSFKVKFGNLDLRPVILEPRTSFSPQSRRARLVLFWQSCVKVLACQ